MPDELDRVLTARFGLGTGDGSAPVSAILLVTGDAAAEDGWSVRTALAIAERIASTRRCLLIDLDVEAARLHEPLGADNVEGVADIFLYGASLKHVVQRPSGYRFEFVPAGIGGESQRILTDSRWRRLLNEQGSRDGVLLAYLNGDQLGLEQLSERVPSVIALARPEDLDRIAGRLSPEAEALAVVSPPPPQPPAPPPPVVEEEEIAPPIEPTVVEPAARSSDQDFESIRVPRNAAREALIADLRARQRAALMAPSPSSARQIEEPPVSSTPPATPAVRAPRPEPSLTEPTFTTSEPRTPVKNRKLLYIALSLVVIAALAIGALLVLPRYFQAPATQPDSAQVPTLGSGASTSSDMVPLAYSVAVEAHQELPLAVERVESLVAEEKDIGFYIAPSPVNSVLYYRIMAGPVEDSAAAAMVMQRLLDKKIKTGASPGDVRRTPLAFLLGEYDGESAARARAGEAGQLGIPAYVIPVVGADGSTRHRVYAGAYSGLAEADVMRQLLQSAGLPDSLVQRVGMKK